MSKVRVVVAAVLLVGSLAACASGSDDEDTTFTSPPVPPSSTGDTCSDPTNDVTRDAGTAPDVGGEPAGVDLITASATLEGDQVVVQFTTNGEIAALSSPSFVVAQGNPYDPFSFEVRAVRDDASATWNLTLITWSQAEQRRSIVTSTTVAANTLSFVLPKDVLPPLANYLSFGATAEVDGAIVFDDCSSLIPPTSG